MTLWFSKSNEEPASICASPEILNLAGEPGQDNLVYRAIHELAPEIGFERGIRAVLTKRIPVGRGLGGGSSDAAAALIGLLRLSGKSASMPRASRKLRQDSARTFHFSCTAAARWASVAAMRFIRCRMSRRCNVAGRFSA